MACELNYSLTGLTGDCLSLSGGSIGITILGSAPPFTINWVSPYTYSVVLPNDTYAYTVTGLTAGTYTFNIVDACVDPGPTTLPATFYISSGTCVSITGVTNTLCNLNNGSLTAATTYDYGNATLSLYHTTLGFITSGTTNIPLGRVFNDLQPGTYYVIANDGAGCTGQSNSVIVQSSTNVDYDLYVVNDSGCNVESGKIYVNNIEGNPPFTYLWSNGATTSYIENLSTGSYSVTVGDSSGCNVTKEAVVELVVPVNVVGEYVTQPSCFQSDGTFVVNVAGGTPPYYYSGSNNVTDVRFENYMTWSSLPAGQFNYFIQDAGLCNTTGGINIAVPSSFNVIQVIPTNSTCGNNQGSISLSITNGTPPYVYTLTGPTNPGSINTTLQSYTFAQLTNGEYTLTITDGSDCSFTQTYTIENETGFDFTFLTTGTTCNLNNGTVKIDVTDGVGPFLYQINGESFQTNLRTQTFSNLPSGSYNLSVTDTSVPCKQTSSFFIGTSQTVDFIYNKVNPTLSNNGSIQIFITSGQPPYTIEWSDNVNGQTGMLVTGLSAGTYTVKVTDNLGCVKQVTIILEGIACSVSYEVYNLCQDDFQNNGQLLKKTPLLMLNEGYTDLIVGEENCILNEAVFEAITIVSGVTATTEFYTSESLTDAPSESLFATTVRNMLLSYEGIGGVTINSTTNQITISSDCESTVSLLDVDIVVNLKIHYDISCACSKSCNPYSYLGRIDFMDDENNVPTHQEITSWGSSNCNCDYTNLNNVINSYDLALSDSSVRANLNYFLIQYNTYSSAKYSGFCEGDVGFQVPDTSLISNYSFPNNFYQKGRPVKIIGNRVIKASQIEGWYTTTIGSTLSAYTDDVRYIRAVSTVGNLPTTGLPGDLILVGNVTNSVGYAWDPLSNSWSTTFYNQINTNILTEIRTKRNKFASVKNDLIMSTKGFTWTNNYLLFHGIKRWVFNNVLPQKGNDVIMENGENIPCGYSQNLGTCTLDPFCGPNKQDDNDVC
jgi:hypothetical protein